MKHGGRIMESSELFAHWMFDDLASAVALVEDKPHALDDLITTLDGADRDAFERWFNNRIAREDDMTTKTETAATTPDQTSAAIQDEGERLEAELDAEQRERVKKLVTDALDAARRAETELARSLSHLTHMPTVQRPFLPVHRLLQAMHAQESVIKMIEAVVTDARAFPPSAAPATKRTFDDVTDGSRKKSVEHEKETKK